MAKNSIVKDYTQMKKAELQAELKKRKVSFKKSDKRDDLIAMLVATERPEVDTSKDKALNIAIILGLFALLFGLALLIIKVL